MKRREPRYIVKSSVVSQRNAFTPQQSLCAGCCNRPQGICKYDKLIKIDSSSVVDRG